MQQSTNVSADTNASKQLQLQLQTLQTVVTQLQQKLEHLDKTPLQETVEDETCIYLSAEDMREFESGSCQLHLPQDRNDNDAFEASTALAPNPVSVTPQTSLQINVESITPSYACNSSPPTHPNLMHAQLQAVEPTIEQWTVNKTHQKRDTKQQDTNGDSDDSEIYTRPDSKKRRFFRPTCPEVEAKRKECVAIKNNMQRNNMDLFAGLLFQPACKFISYFVYQNKQSTALRQGPKAVVWRFQLSYRQLDGKEVYLNQESKDLEEVLLKRRIWFMQPDNQQLPVVQAARKAFQQFDKCQPSMRHLQEIVEIVNKRFAV